MSLIDEEKRLKLISVNVEQNKHYDIVLEFLLKENPDVVCLQEVLKSDLPKYEVALKKKSFFKPLYKGSKALQHNDFHGIAILADDFSRTHYEYYYGSEEAVTLDQRVSDTNLRNYAQQPVLVVDIFHKGETFRFVTTHLTWTWEGVSTAFQLLDAEKLLSILKKEGELVLCGDFNAPRGGETFSRIAAAYKDQIPLKYKSSLDPNLHKAKGLEYMVDGLFTTSVYGVKNMHFASGVSDHMAIVADISKS